MQILILGGTAWLGREIARQAMHRGHAVTCLARGDSGPVVHGATLVQGDRSRPGGYDAVRRDWDAVVEVSWQPGMVRDALIALHERTAHWTYVSSISAYAEADGRADESARLLEPTGRETAGRDEYGAAKVACERASSEFADDLLLIARAGLIGGPGDHTGRSGYWVARAARAPDRPMLVPDAPDLPTQVVDVRDLAGFLVRSSEAGVLGTLDTVGPAVPLEEWVELARVAGGHVGAVVRADPRWLLDRGVSPWMGPESLPLWPGPEPTPARSGAAALAAGLHHRSRAELMDDLLRWERDQGLDRPRPAGLTDSFEQELLGALGS